MKILVTIYSEVTSAGGVNKTIRELAKSLSKIGHKVTVLQTNPFNLPSEEINEEFKIIRVKSKFGEYCYEISPDMYFYFKKHFEELDPDIIHIHGYHTLFSPEIIWTIRNIDAEVPIVFSPHFGISSHVTFIGKFLWKPYNELIGRKIMKYPKKIIVASNFEANNINSLLGVHMNKIVVIPHGVDIIDLKKNYCNDNKINLLYAGYLLELKGVQYIIETLQELIYNKGTDVLLTIVGKGSFEDKLRKLAKKLGVDNFINWKGFMNSNELLNEFKKADIFLLLSESENYGIVVTEALATGTPVIVTKRAALNEFLDEPGCFGVDYPPNPSNVAELILKIYESNTTVGPFSNKIRIWDEVAKDYEKLYKKILNGN